MLWNNVSKYGLIWVIFIVLFTLQSPLESIWGGFSYIDEFSAATVLFLIIIYFEQVKSLLKRKTIFSSMLLLSVFLLSGLTANIVYKFQSSVAIAVDLFTNIKFYMALATGFLLFSKASWFTIKKYANITAKFLSAFLAFIFIVDRLMNLYGGEVRYGIRSVVLFYSHPTYFAGAMVFLLALFAVTCKNGSKKYIAMDIIMLAFTLRSKAIVGAVIYIFLFWYVVMHKKRLKLWQLALIAMIALFLAWGQIYFYYIKLAGNAARSIFTLTSFKIFRDFFPIGTGFATFASHEAAKNYSPVYFLYGFADMWEVSYKNPGAFLDDTFWPIIIGQTGFLGTTSYVFVLLLTIRQCFRLKRNSSYLYMGAVFIIAYLLVSSIAEPAFNNSIAVPLGFLLGIIFRNAERETVSKLNR